MITITEKVRLAIPEVLKGCAEPIQEKQLLALLAVALPELKGKNDEPRAGVLRGVLNKLDSRPVDKLGITRKNNKVYFYYAKGETVLLEQAIKNFSNEIDEKNLLSIDLMKTDPAEIELKKAVHQAIEDLNAALVAYK